MGRFAPLATLAMAGGMLALGCGASTVSSAGGALAGHTANEVAQLAVQAAKRAGSVHYVLVSSDAHSSETITGDSSMAEGRQIVTSGSAHIQALLVRGVAYVNGDATGLQSALGLTPAVAAKYAGDWISLTRDDPPYASVVAAVRLDHILGQVTPSGPLTLLQPADTSGRGASVGLSGGLPAPVQGATGTSTLYVSVRSPTLPVRFTGRARSGRNVVHDEATFTGWGRPLELSAPAGAISFESLPSA
jgi:hypothetical protein